MSSDEADYHSAGGSEDEFVAAKKKAAPKATKAKPKKEPLKTSSVANVDQMDIDDDDDYGVVEVKSKGKKETVKKSAGGEGKTIEEIYQKKTQLEHILLRPDTYIGSVESMSCPMWVFEENKLVNRSITYVPGLYKIFDEILVNAADNKVRDPSMDKIEVVIDTEKNLVSVYNNGRGIPIEIHAKEQVYVPELIFGHLLTSSNYDDSEKKVTGGRNGYGAKLCNIFSSKFTVETGDSKAGKVYKQNMSKKSEPKITQKKTDDFTRITFEPDLEKFGMTELDVDIVALFSKRAYDIAGCVDGVKVLLNGSRIKVKSFKDYIGMYLPEPKEIGAKKPSIIYEKVSDRWEVAFTVSDGQFQQVSFVNSICTSKGGTHVNHVTEQIVSHLLELVKKKDKKTTFKPHQAKQQISIYINCLIENPAFDSQTKENMTLKVSSFGSKCGLGEDFMKKVSKSGIIDNILAVAKFRSDLALKKTDGTKATRISGISKLDDANQAGTKNGANCTLILTEGDSAKTLAVSGLSVVGRDQFGVFPLRGKLLNVRDTASSMVQKNAEITALKQIIGLQQGKVYNSVKDLRYGHIMIMTDQDHDGSHIKGLIINLLDTFWPSLLKIPGFLQEFITPIAIPKTKGGRKQEISFYTIPEYEEWKKENDDGKGYYIKYFKGLGTSTPEDAKKYFADMAGHRKPFEAATAEDSQLVDLAFNKKRAEDRKEWLKSFTDGTYMDNSVDEITITDFINRELILFSMADNVRSIPSSIDGMKPGQRKILYSCFKRNLKNEIKVTQLAGYVSEHSAYHHGEASLFSTIVGMAQNFVGSNNLPLLEPRGQFGTRLQGGKDHASARYIFTALNPLARIVFHPEDDKLLKYLNDDGQDIEPAWYLPILPMLLVNGGEGIGTGWSSSIPNYNPKDIVANLHRLMDGEAVVPMTPWYRGFKGEVSSHKEKGFRFDGTIRKLSDTTLEITELPLKTWTQSYKEQLEAWMIGDEAKKIVPWVKDFKEYHTDASVHFVVTLTEENMALAEKEGLDKKFKLSSTVATSNLVCFDLEGKIKKYDNVEDLMRDFFDLRLSYYHKRKAYRFEAMLNRLEFEWKKLDNKARFVLEIIQGTLIVQNRKRTEILKELKAKKYFAISKKTEDAMNAGIPGAAPGSTPEDEGDGDSEGDEAAGAPLARDYEYLLGMPIWNLTLEKVEQLKKERDEKNKEIAILAEQTPAQLWRSDLDTFLVHWESFEQGLAELESMDPSKIKKIAAEAKKNRKPAVRKPKAPKDDDVNDSDFEVSKAKLKAQSRSVKQTTLSFKPAKEEDKMPEVSKPKVLPSKAALKMKEPKDEAPKVKGEGKRAVEKKPTRVARTAKKRIVESEDEDDFEDILEKAQDGEEDAMTEQELEQSTKVANKEKAAPEEATKAEVPKKVEVPKTALPKAEEKRTVEMKPVAGRAPPKRVLEIRVRDFEGRAYLNSQDDDDFENTVEKAQDDEVADKKVIDDDSYSFSDDSDRKVKARKAMQEKAKILSPANKRTAAQAKNARARKVDDIEDQSPPKKKSANDKSASPKLITSFFSTVPKDDAKVSDDPPKKKRLLSKKQAVTSTVAPKDAPTLAAKPTAVAAASKIFSLLSDDDDETGLAKEKPAPAKKKPAPAKKPVAKKRVASSDDEDEDEGIAGKEAVPKPAEGGRRPARAAVAKKPAYNFGSDDESFRGEGSD
ncbi:DNA topoisomerase 2 [Irineochytrium annulatum]|nr:DNA topoisomerase 2 [Irineochytrium annulatum]